MAKPTIDELIKFCQDQFKCHIDVINDLEHSTEFLAYQDMIDLSRWKIEKYHEMKDKFRAMEEYLTEYRDSKEYSNVNNIANQAVWKERDRLKNACKSSMNLMSDDTEYAVGFRNGIRAVGLYIDMNDEDFTKCEHYQQPTTNESPLTIPTHDEKNESKAMISYSVIDWCKMITDMGELSYSLDCYDEGNDTRVIDINDILHLMIKYVHNERNEKNGGS